MVTASQDLRYATRSLLRGRGTTLVAMLSLAVGIAANATVFSLVQAVEFPRLIYPDASRIVFLESGNPARGVIGMPVSAPDAHDIAAAARTLRSASLVADQTSVLREGEVPRRVSGRRVEPSFFEVMRVAAALGGALAPSDGPEAIVLSHDLWRSAFAGDPSIVGRSIRFDGGLVTVIGVMPARFDADADFWVRLTQSPADFARDDRQFTLFARLAPEATLRDAEVELREISRRLAADHPATNRDWVNVPIALRRMHGRDSRGVFILLQVAVGFVLLIACANIANLLLARATRRRHEMALRVALGAARSRLVRALLTESVLLSLTGGALGVLLSMWGIRLVRTIGGFPDVIDPQLNTIVLGFTAAVALLTGVLCGLAPALRASAVIPGSVLRAEDSRAGGRRGRLGQGLVAVQIAAALVLAGCAGLMVRSLTNRYQLDLGFEPHGAIRASVGLPFDRYRDPAVIRRTADAILDRLAASPDVAAAGLVTWALPTGAGAQRALTRPSARDRALPSSIRRGVEAVTPAYFAALGVTLVQGRAFASADREGGAPVAIIDEQLARHLWPDRSPLGEALRLGAPGEAVPIVTVVGVVSSILRSPMHDAPVARVYVPFAQHPNAMFSVVVRTRSDAGAAGRALQSAVAAVDRSVLVEQLRTLEADLAQFVAPIRMVTLLLSGFGLAGLLLAALGVFGMMSYAIAQREREMAVRTALGANPRDIYRLVFSSALRMTAVGLAAGLVLTLAATRALASFLFGVSPTDPATLALVLLFLALVSLAACYRPARVAATADPIVLLKQ